MSCLATKWVRLAPNDFSVTFPDQISVLFGSPSHTKTDLKKSEMCPIQDQCDPILNQTCHTREEIITPGRRVRMSNCCWSSFLAQNNSRMAVPERLIKFWRQAFFLCVFRKCGHRSTKKHCMSPSWPSCLFLSSINLRVFLFNPYIRKNMEGINNAHLEV